MNYQKIFDWFYRAEHREAQIEFNSIVSNCIAEVDRYDDQRINALITRQGRAIWNKFKQQQEEDLRRNRNPPLCCVDDILYACHLPSQGSLGVPINIDRFTLLKARPLIIKLLDEFSSRQYEGAMCMAMLLAGAKKVYLTPDGNEGGVDFFALLEGTTGTHLFGKSTQAIRVVGQTKKYEKRETITRFNCFPTVLNNVQHLVGRVAEVMPSWFRVERGPIVGIYVAHSGFQSGVVDVAARHGIVLADSVDIGEMCCMSNILDPMLEPLERTLLFRDMVNDYLQ